MNLCSHCKGQNRDEARFCGHCGGSLTVDVPSPTNSVSDQGQSLSRKQLNVAGWLSVIDAVMTIPPGIIGLILGKEGGVASQAILNFLTLISLGLFVYIFIILKRLLNTLFNFHATDSLILLLISANTIFATLSVLLPEEGVPVNAFTFCSLVAFGVVGIVFAMKLLRLPNDLFGLLKPFCYTNICLGFCLATIILFPIMFFAYIVSCLIQAIIFFRAMDHPLVVD